MDFRRRTILDATERMRIEMNTNTMSRRKFCQLAASGIVLAPSFGRAYQQPNAGPITAREVVQRIRQHVGVTWRTPTADEFKVGDPDASITGITTTFMSTFEVLQRSVAAGNNFIITHEPTFWSATDIISDLKDDPLYQQKLKYIAENKLVVWRFHDHWHAHRPDGIFAGWNRVMGWDQYAVAGTTPFSHEYVIPETRLEDLAKEMHAKLNLRSLRLVGNPDLKVSRLGNGGHYIPQCMNLLPRVDAIMVFECREWEAAEYVRDAIAAGQKKALIQMPHEGGEEMGMDECARWLRTFVSEVPVKFIASGDPFWLAA
jgi:putative NIF3 family GTP cyclohydrolase 1 type 2